MPSETPLLRSNLLDHLHKPEDDRASLSNDNHKTITNQDSFVEFSATQACPAQTQYKQSITKKTTVKCSEGGCDAQEDPWKWNEVGKDTNYSQFERRHTTSSLESLILASLSLKTLPGTLATQRRAARPLASLTNKPRTFQAHKPISKRGNLPAPFALDVGRGLAFFILCLLYSASLLFFASFLRVPLLGRVFALATHVLNTSVQLNNQKTIRRKVLQCRYC